METTKQARYFTEAARVAAAKARREKAEFPKSDGLTAFVVREPMPGKGFGWEIRRHGGLSVERGPFTFASGTEASQAGEMALAVLRARTGRGHTTDIDVMPAREG